VLALSLGLTALLFVAPAATGGGEQIVQPVTTEHRSLAALLLLLALRAAATVSSYAAGTPGGVFAPILGLAAVAGVAFAETITALLPGLDLELAAFAAAAMAALFTGSVRAPLVAVVLVSELTDAYPAVLAITLSSAMASLTAARLHGRPLYELLLERTLRLQR
jgi:CIC family chloride channel protein